MKKLRVVTVVGTRPEIIRLSRTIVLLDKSMEHILVHTGQNYDYELNQIFFDDLSLRKPDVFLNAAGLNAAKTISNVISKFDDFLDEYSPDAVLVLGDTNSCMSILPAKRRKIPTFHMEAGNRCFDLRVPEELNRRIIDHIADVNITYSSISRDYLINEGLPADLIIKVGSPMHEVLKHFRDNINNSNILEKLKLIQGQFFLISAHREENINGQNFVRLVEVLNWLASTYEYPVIVSTHPRTQKMIDCQKVEFHTLVRLIKPLGFFDYNKLQTTAKAVLSDSGTISEEASILGFSALNIRDAHERPEAMEQTAVIMTGMNIDRIAQSLVFLDSYSSKNINSVFDYIDDNVSEKIVRIIYSYVDYVNRVVWKKY
jgi:UDP-N-acetylglucosamine 2-epimerase (non-hydrolysing)